MNDIISYDRLDRATLITHPTKRYGQRSLDQITHIIPHHTGDEVNDFNRHARYHVNNKDWPGLAYHMYNDGSGPVVANEIHKITYHCKGFNTPSIGVCISGNFNHREPIDEEYWQWIHMIITIERYLGRELSVALHCQKRPTTCPGKLFDMTYFMKELIEFRHILL